MVSFMVSIFFKNDSFSEGSGEEMKKVLLLLLGCAVQSDKKEEFINKIKELDLSLQEAIVEQIRKVHIFLYWTYLMKRMSAFVLIRSGDKRRRLRSQCSSIGIGPR